MLQSLVDDSRDILAVRPPGGRARVSIAVERMVVLTAIILLTPVTIEKVQLKAEPTVNENPNIIPLHH